MNLSMLKEMSKESKLLIENTVRQQNKKGRLGGGIWEVTLILEIEILEKETI